MRWCALTIMLVLVARAEAGPEEATQPKSHSKTKFVAVTSIVGVHMAYATWAYFAWYREANLKNFYFAHEPAFAAATYAGGADKLGHVWSNYALTRGTTAVLVAGGWPRRESSLVSAGLTEVAFLLTEIEDGFVFGFETYDLIANGSGAVLGLVMENFPAVDRLLDFRVQYLPSEAYRYHLRKEGSVDVGQDYTGQSYLLSLHLGA
jgi:hypothetical protein